jgi:hypothetical protein
MMSASEKIRYVVLFSVVVLFLFEQATKMKQILQSSNLTIYSIDSLTNAHSSSLPVSSIKADTGMVP